MDLSPLQKISQLTKQDDGETLRDVGLIYPFPIITGGLYRAQIFSKKRWYSLNYFSELTPPEAVTQTCMWSPCEADRFSYGESPRTPPLEGTSLHRRNNSVERPWGILSLFTTCLLITTLTQTSGVFVKQVVFLTVNHHRPLPLTELHSTDETIVWRDPGGSWACLWPVSEWIHPFRGCR